MNFAPLSLTKYIYFISFNLTNVRSLSLSKKKRNQHPSYLPPPYWLLVHLLAIELECHAKSQVVQNEGNREKGKKNDGDTDGKCKWVCLSLSLPAR